MQAFQFSHKAYLIGAMITAFSLSANSVYAKSISTQTFVTKASTSDIFEIESSELALQKAQSEEVKTFAQQMIKDHTMTSKRMQEVLSSSNIDVAPANELDRKHQKLLDKLESASTRNFDRQYIMIQTDAHKEAVNLFSNYSKNGKDASLKDFASETLPALKEHLNHVKQLKSNK